MNRLHCNENNCCSHTPRWTMAHIALNRQYQLVPHSAAAWRRPLSDLMQCSIYLGRVMTHQQARATSHRQAQSQHM